MQEPSVRTSRLAIAGGLAAILVIGGVGFFLGRTTAPVPETPPTVVFPVPIPTSSPQEPEDLERGDLIALAAQAADAYSSGEAVPQAVTDAVGQHFELLLPFGCTGPSDPGSSLPMQWHYDEEEQTLRISIEPIVWNGSDWGLEAGEGTAEGFWINRPWSSRDICASSNQQAVSRGVEPITLPGQTLAIAQLLRGEDDRDGRRDGRPYETVQRVPADEFNAAQGFRLHIAGRLEAIADGTPVRCIQPAGVEQRPICIIGARIDTVNIENPATDETLASWSINRSAR